MTEQDAGIIKEGLIMMPERKRNLRDLIFLPSANIVDGKGFVEMGQCKHRRIKRNFPFGRKSSPRRFCKDCGKPIMKMQIKPKQKKQQPHVEKENYPDISKIV